MEQQRSFFQAIETTDWGKLMRTRVDEIPPTQAPLHEDLICNSQQEAACPKIGQSVEQLFEPNPSTAMDMTTPTASLGPQGSPYLHRVVSL